MILWLQKKTAEKKMVKKESLPKQWVELVKEAMGSKITKGDFKRFLKEEKEKREKGLRE
ncbi:hypothetical protein [Heyndrickxia sporothermodurans]|uniref:Sin domain-containing protein n=1 Tax=Heyndrickxia sporothermodurans TaxID=46224 RepID=A0A150KLQ9_9BACI|nr:hypothetical protein [Heyndrickxia sporothermodurans]KYC90821.1 hypothetical protein B4102_3813 [Heyndrickxia sporothermodurans]